MTTYMVLPADGDRAILNYFRLGDGLVVADTAEEAVEKYVEKYGWAGRMRVFEFYKTGEVFDIQRETSVKIVKQS